MELKGKIHEISETIQVTETFKKREVVIEYAENPQYPEFIKFEATQDRCSLLDNVKIGDQVEIFFNLRGRPWTDNTGKKVYFNSLQLWRLNALTSNSANNNLNDSLSAPADFANSSIDEDDLPF